MIGYDINHVIHNVLGMNRKSFTGVQQSYIAVACDFSFH